MAVKPVIIDHLFGDIDLPGKGYAWHKNRWTGIHHYGGKKPLNPSPGDAVELLVYTSSEYSVDRVLAWFSVDEWVTKQEFELTRSQLHWDMTRWGWLQAWTGRVPPQVHGTMLRYRLAAHIQGSERWVFADNQADNFDLGSNFSIWYDTDQLPGWARQARVYQVFVDRFNPGAGNSWIQTDDLMRPCGGTLKGVTEKLGHIVDMGFNAIWLSPIFTSPSHHGYDMSDYYMVNPCLGTDQDFDELITQAHKQGIRVILDFVANHCSNQLPKFRDACSDPNSPYHDWFTWKRWPDKYQSFYDVESMPELDLRHGKPARAYMLSCAQHWLERGADGFRLDYAHGPVQDFWVDFRRACRHVKPDCWLFGEIVQPADATAGFAGGLDGSLDFHLCQALRLTFAQQTWPLSRLAGFLQAHRVYFEKDFSLPAFIDNHDMNRFLIPAYGDERLLKIALMLLYLLPGPPIVYYGTEFALSQNRSIHGEEGLGFDEARLPLDWQVDSPLKGFLGQLAHIRETYPVILEGKVKVVQCDDQRQVLILQTGEGQSAIYLLINRSDKKQTINTKPEASARYINPFTGEEYSRNGDGLTVELEGLQACILIPR